MSVVGVEGIDNESFPAETPNDSSLNVRHPVPVTKRSSNSIGSRSSKDQTWQPSRGISFASARATTSRGPGTLAYGTTCADPATTRNASSRSSLPPRSPPTNPSQPRPLRYTPSKQRTDNLFMPSDNDEDGFGDEDEDLSELLAPKETLEDNSEVSEVSMEANDQSIQPAQQSSETQTVRMDPARFKAPVMFPDNPRNELKVESSLKQNKAKKPWKARIPSDICKTSAPFGPSGINDIALSRSQVSRTSPANDLPLNAPHYLLSPYPHDWSAHQKSEPLISEDYLSSDEIARLAQLPAIVDLEPDFEDIDTKGAETHVTGFSALFNYDGHLAFSFWGLKKIIDGMIGAIRSSKAGSSYKPLISRSKLLEIQDEIAAKQTEIETYVHNARKILLLRRTVESPLQLDADILSAQEFYQPLVHKAQATDPVDEAISSQKLLYNAWQALEVFYWRRNMVGLLERLVIKSGREQRLPVLIVQRKAVKKGMKALDMTFKEAYAYKRMILKGFDAGPLGKLAITTNQSLQVYGRAVREWRIARADASRIGGSGIKGINLSPAASKCYESLEKLLWEFAQFEMCRVARLKKLSIDLGGQRTDEDGPIILRRAPLTRPKFEQGVLLRPRVAVSKDSKSMSCRRNRPYGVQKELHDNLAERGSKNNKEQYHNLPALHDKLKEVSQQYSIISKNTFSDENDRKSADFKVATQHSETTVKPTGTSSAGRDAGGWQSRRKRSRAHRNVIKVQPRSYNSLAFELDSKSPTTPESFTGRDRTLQVYGDILSELEHVANDAATQCATTDAAQGQLSNDASQENLSQSDALKAQEFRSSHSPMRFSMKWPEHGSSAKHDPLKLPAYWSYSLYSGPNKEAIKLHYCKNKTDTERVAQLFKDEEVIGFDIEWKINAQARDGTKKNVSLIQIASEERIALFHIARYREDEASESLVAPTLKAIMESPHITKVGVAIKGDCTRLRRFMGIESRGLFELSHLYKLVKYSGGKVGNVNKVLVSLATQVEEHLGLPLWKGDARTSDWSLDLNMKQVQYAASDSYAGFQLYHTLEYERKQLSPTPPRPYHAELNLPIRLTSGESIDTDDEPEDLDDEFSTTGQSNEPPSIEELARDFLKIKLKCPTLPVATTPKRTPRSNPQPCRPEVVVANEWVAQWRTTLPQDYKPSAAPASLRAHALWHEQGFSVPEAAALLRDPPLQNATVANYVLDALKAEKLAFEKERLAALSVHVPPAMWGRHQRFFDKAGISGA